MEHPSSISQQEILDQLNRILASPIFMNSGLLSGFLSFIINEHLEGRSHLLKEYTIGVSVLSKKTGYDTKEDASVRIHAGRLRKSLAAYYSDAGRNDIVLISVPTGGYVPKIDINTPADIQNTQESNILYKPSLAIFPFTCYDKEQDYALADGICDQLCTEFTNFDELAVISYYSSRMIAENMGDIRKAALLLDAKYILTGNIRSIGSSVRISVQLMISRSFFQIWAFTYERERPALETFAIQDDIVRHVVNQIAGSHGIIVREIAKKATANKIANIQVFNAVHWYYFLVSELSEDLFAKGLSSMQDVVQIDPKYSLGWAILSETYVAGYFYRYNCRIPDPLEEAVRCGKEALRIDPRNDHAYQALGLAYLFLHQQKNCLNIADQWIRTKSNSAVVAGGIGFCLICSGEYERGYLMICDSIQLNPYYPWWFNAGLSIYHYVRGEYDDTIYWAEKLNHHSRVWELILKTAAHSEMEQHQAKQLCYNELVSQLPDSAHLKNIVGSFIQVPELVDRLWTAITLEERAMTN
jgi:TolB-like protein